MSLSHKALCSLTDAMGEKFLSNIITSQEVIDALAIVAEQTISEELGDLSDDIIMDLTCMLYESVGFEFAPYRPNN